MSHEQAMDIIISGHGTQFDPIVTDAVFLVNKQFKEITEKYK